MPKRFGWTLLIVLCGLLVSIALIMYLAFSAGPDAPSRLVSDRISNEGTVSWSESGGTTVQAGSLNDGLLMLGYGHARSRSWQMALWRQAALGQLSEWFGPDALEADKLIRRLDIPGDAREAWDALDTDTRNAVSAYAAGVDLALLARDVNRAAPFLILGIESESWEPWHSLAVERLFAWISSAPLPSEEAILPEDWSRADRQLQQLLGFHGSAVNWVAGVNHVTSPYLSARLATGTTGVPLFSESEMNFGVGRFTGLMMPGTVVAPLGRTDVDAWGILARSDRTSEVITVDGDDVETTHHRINLRGTEIIEAAHRLGDRLILEPPPRAGESRAVRVLTWSGQSTQTDASTWVSSFSGATPRTTLLAPDGIHWGGVGFTTSGSPSTTVQPQSNILFVTSAPAAMNPSATVEGMSSAPALGAWMGSTLSRAASERLDALVQHLPDSILASRQEREAVRYLTNWNLEYGAAEPGASILESLTTLLAPSDSSDADHQTALQQTIENLTRLYGPDMSSWRWETVQERRVSFPGATTGAADGGRTEERFVDKYQPVQIRAPGHPQSLVWGSPPSQDSLRITSAWEGALSLRDGALFYRRPFVDFNRFLGTFLTGDRPPALNEFRRGASDESTTFIPRR